MDGDFSSKSLNTIYVPDGSNISKILCFMPFTPEKLRANERFICSENKNATDYTHP